MVTEPQIIAYIDAEAARLGISPSTFTLRAANDGDLYQRLKRGKTITIRTWQKIKKYAEKTP